MSAKGINRYFSLFKHIQNPFEYILNKHKRNERALLFTTKPNPISFRVPNSLYQVFKEIFMADVYEIDTLVKKLPAKPIVIDIGANAGFFDIQLLSKLRDAVIYAYEPIPANIKAVQTVIAGNPWLSEQIHLHQVAVTGLPQKELQLYAEAEENSQVVASVFAGFNERNMHTITVACLSLTDIISSIDAPVIHLLKLDCEGSEYDIIYNTSPDLIKRISRMVIEVHDIDEDKYNLRYFDAYLRSLGYETKHEPINSFCHALEATLK